MKIRLSVERRIAAARAWVKEEPGNPLAERELAAAVAEKHREYNEMRDVCNRINCEGGDA